MNDARRPAGRAMSVGAVGVNVDDPCEGCGGDVFSCSCEPAAEVFSADDVAQAVETWRRRADTAVKANGGYRDLVADLKAEVRELRGMAPSSPVVVPRAADRPAPAPPGPVRPPEGPPRPTKLSGYLARLEDPPRIAYATALADVLCGLADEVHPATLTEASACPWFAKVDAKVRRLAASSTR